MTLEEKVTIFKDAAIEHEPSLLLYYLFIAIVIARSRIKPEIDRGGRKASERRKARIN